MFEEILRIYPDFPKKGINFIDVIPLLQDKVKFSALIEEIGKKITSPNVATVEARGFLFAAPLLIKDNNVGNIIPFRKKGKLPFSENDLETIEITKEYGKDELFFRKSDIAAGNSENGCFNVSVLDDVLATGGTAKGIADKLEGLLIKKDGKAFHVKISEFVFLCEIDGLGGRALLEDIAPVKAIMHI